MRKTILALATAGALAGTALPVLAHDYDDDDGNYRNRYYRGDYYRDYDRPSYRHHDYDDYWRRRRHEGYRNWWWKHHHYDPDRPWVRKHYY
jgi:hypothetical protein